MTVRDIIEAFYGLMDQISLAILHFFQVLFQEVSWMDANVFAVLLSLIVYLILVAIIFATATHWFISIRNAVLHCYNYTRSRDYRVRYRESRAKPIEIDPEEEEWRSNPLSARTERMILIVAILFIVIILVLSMIA